ncbi:MAG: transglutaminase-like domain-containing protein [Luteolibacter sp.]
MDSPIQPPPRLLLGASLLFWGGMTDHAFIGLVLALLVEGAHWIRFRWSFGDTACSVAWRFSMMLTVIGGTLIWLDGDRYTALPKLMIWIPVLLFPLQFVQNYGLRDFMALNSFSFFAKLRRERNLRLGLSPSVIHFNFGNLYVILTIVSASLGRYAQQYVFFVGLVILAGWLVFARVRSRPIALVIVLAFAGAIGLSGQIGLNKLYSWVTDRNIGDGFSGTDPTANKTNIGSLGRIKQSPAMLWRLTPETRTAPPRLMRTASYNRYKGITWTNDFPESVSLENDSFRDLDVMSSESGETHLVLRESETLTTADLRKKLPAYQIRGASANKQPLPLPGDTSSLLEFELEVELDGIEINPMGTVRVLPIRPIIDAKIRWKDSATGDAPPFEEDLEVSPLERATIEETVSLLGLREMPTTQAKIARLRQWFGSEFQYTRYLSIPRVRYTRPSPIEIFLTGSKRGHCEYFATSATLLLRAAGVPSRYAIGFTVAEKDTKRNEYVIRGTHGHAWTRVWDDSQNKWIDFDPTPPSWLAQEIGADASTPWLADAYQRFKEDFFLWRSQPRNRIAATAVMWFIGGSVFIFVARRLWKSRMVVDKEANRYQTPKGSAKTPLHDLESKARKLLGPRPPGVTLATWLSGLLKHGIQQSALDEALAIHQQLRFDPKPAPSVKNARLQDLANAITAAVRKSRPTT